MKISSIENLIFLKNTVVNNNPKFLFKDRLYNDCYQKSFGSANQKINYEQPTTAEKITIIEHSKKTTPIINTNYIEAYNIPNKNDLILLNLKNVNNINGFYEKKLAFITKRNEAIKRAVQKNPDIFNKIGVSFATPFWLKEEDDGSVSICLKKAKGIWLNLFEIQQNKDDTEFASSISSEFAERRAELSKLGIEPIAYFEDGLNDTDKPVDEIKLLGLVFDDATEKRVLANRDKVYNRFNNIVKGKNDVNHK